MKAIYKVLLVGSVVVTVVAAAVHTNPAVKRPVAKKVERPWLSPVAEAQIFGPGGLPGPLFDNVDVGGPPPSPEVRRRIADFARANDVDIRLEVAEGELAAVRVAVTFAGCCGYVGADALADRLRHQPGTADCSTCGPAWVDTWGYPLDPRVHVRGHVHVNRVELQWERTESFVELLDRAEALFGKAPAALREAARDRLTEFEPGRYLLQVPFVFDPGFVLQSAWGGVWTRDDLEVELAAEHDRIAAVAMTIRGNEYEKGAEAALRARWGRPEIAGGPSETWTWHRDDRTITVELGYPTTIAIRKRRGV
jgi:hypothetical protein